MIERMRTPEQPTERELAHLLEWSFRLSQGSGGTQEHILKYMRQYYGYCFDEQLVNTAYNIFEKKFFSSEGRPKMASTLQHASHAAPDSSEPFEISQTNSRPENVNGLLTTLYREKYITVAFDELAKEIAKSIWVSDYEFLVGVDLHGGGSREAGRPNKPDIADPNDYLTDRWHSYGVYYLIKNQNIGLGFYDVLLADCRAQTATTMQRQFPGQMKGEEVVSSVVTVYNQHHPDTPVSSEMLSNYLQLEKN